VTERGPLAPQTVHLAWWGGSDANPHSDGHRGQTLTLDLELPEGSHHDFVLVLSEQALTEPPPDAERGWRAAIAGGLVVEVPSATESVVLLGPSLSPRMT